MKKITFEWQRGLGKHDKVTEVVEFDDEDTEEMIDESFQEWVWDKIGDRFTWYES